MIAGIISQPERRRVWLVSRVPWPSLRVLQERAGDVAVEHVVSGGRPHLYLIEDTESLVEIATATGMFKNMKSLLPRKPSIQSTFDVYRHEDMVVYFKEPCSAKDVQEAFFLHVYAAYASDLPEHRKPHGFENLDFHLNGHGARAAERCVAERKLPDYPILRIHTGQYTDEGCRSETEHSKCTRLCVCRSAACRVATRQAIR